jgi:hypothetical protein
MDTNFVRTFLRGSTEVELIGSGLSSTDIWVHCLGRRGVGSYDITLEDLRARLFDLVRESVRMDLHRFWPTFDGDWMDLVHMFYYGYMTPKCRYKGKKYYFDGDYMKALQEGIPYLTLIDRYANSTHVSFETYVRGCVKNRLLDGIRGGVKGYDAAGRKVSVDESLEACGDSTLVKFGLLCSQDGFLDDSSAEIWHDPRAAARCHEQMAVIREQDAATARRMLVSYIKMRSSLEADIRAFFDFTFEVPDSTEDSPEFQAFVVSNRLGRYFSSSC